MTRIRVLYAAALIACACTSGITDVPSDGGTGDGSGVENGGSGDAGADEAPVATADAYETTTGILLSVAAGPGTPASLLANDALGTPTAALVSFGTTSATTTPAGTSLALGAGALQVNADGSFTFTSDTQFTGAFTFSYRLENAAGFSDATATITVRAGATATDDAYNALLNTAFVRTATDTDDLLDNDLGFPAPTIDSFGGGSLGGSVADHAVGTTVPVGAGSLRVDANGAFAFTPDTGFTGTFTFSYRAQNFVGSDTATVTLTVRSAPAFTSANMLTLTTGASTNLPFTVTTTGFPSPAVAQTGLLPMGVTFTSNADGTATLAGTPIAGSGGSYPLTLTASNGVGTNATQTLTVLVQEGTQFTSATATTFEVGTTGTFTFRAIGVPAPSLTRTGSLPLGVTFSDNGDGTATLAGTPAAGSGGVYPLSVTASNGVAPSTQSFTLTVEEAPTLAGVPPTGTRNATYSHAFTVTGYPAPTLSVTAGTLPAGLALNGTSLAGTPTAQGTSSGIEITASNGVSPAATLTFSLTINGASAITSATSATFTVGSLGSFTVTATGVPTPTLSRTGTLPSGVTFTDNGDGTATLAGTPTGSGGSFPLTFTASNGIGSSATQSFTLTVQQAPSISGTPPTGTRGTAYLHTFTIAGHPAPTLTLTAGTLPTGLSLTSTGISGTPSVQGTFSGLSVTASNGVGTPATLSFSLTVNGAPAITSVNAATFTVGAAGSFSVVTTGVPTASIARTGTLPSGVTFTDNGNGTGTLAGTPSGSGGTFPLTFTASNGVGSNATQSFTLTVQQAPSISGAPAAGTRNAAYSHSFSVGGFPAPTLAVTAGTLPTGLSLAGASITGTPTVAGTFSGITVTASNGVGSDAAISFSITITSAPAITSSNATTFTLGSAGSFTVTTTGVPTPTLSRTGTLPTGVTFTDNGNGTGTLAGTPTGSGGSYPLTLVASNGVGSNASQSFTLTVQQAPSLSGTPPSGSVGAAYSHAFTVGGYPTPTLSVTGGTLPNGVTLSGNALSGTPTVGGTFSNITITASNGVTPAATLTFSITITAVPQPGNDTFGVTGNVSISVPAGSGVLANDTLNSGTLATFGTSTGTASSTTVPGSITTTGGGALTLNADGSFTYNPAANFTGADSFAYRVTNSGGAAVATVTLNVANKIWFVDMNSVGGNGRQTQPYSTIATALTAAASGDAVYVITRSAYPGTTLKSGVRLIGQSQTLNATSLGFTPAPFSVLPTTAASPTLNSAVTLVSNGTLSGFSIVVNGQTGLSDGAGGLTGVNVTQTSVTATNAAAVILGATSGTLSLISASANGTTNGIRLTNTTAAFSVLGNGTNDGSGGTINGTTGNTVHLTNATNVTLRSMRLEGAPTGGDIESFGNGVKSDITGTASAALTISFSRFTGNTARAIYGRVAGNGTTSFTVTNNLFTADATVGGLTDVMFDYQGSGTNNSFAVSNNTFTDIPGAVLQVQTSSLATGLQIVRGRSNNNSVSGVAGGFSSGFNISMNEAFGSTLVYEAIGNTFANNGGQAISLNHGVYNSNLHGRIQNNNVASVTASYSSAYAFIFSPQSSPAVTGSMCIHATGNNAIDAGGLTRTFRIRQVGAESNAHPALAARFQGFTGNTAAAFDTFLRSTNNNFTGTLQLSNAAPNPWNYLDATCQSVP